MAIKKITKRNGKTYEYLYYSAREIAKKLSTIITDKETLDAVKNLFAQCREKEDGTVL